MPKGDESDGPTDRQESDRSSHLASSPNAGWDGWPDQLADDYHGAAIRLATVAQDGVQRLIFACVELYPQEVQLPPPVGEFQHIKTITLRWSVTPVGVHEALTWYRDLACGTPTVPRMPNCRLESVVLVPEPRPGRFIVGADVPFEPTWHGGARLHRLVNMADPEASVGDWALPGASPARWERARSWLAQRLHFDLLASDEWLGGGALLAPNPLVRGMRAQLVGSDPTGDERLRVTCEPRTGADGRTLEVRLVERRQSGLATSSTHALDEFGRVEVGFPQPVDQIGMELVDQRLGLLGHVEPGPLIRTALVNLGVVTSRVGVQVPSPRRMGKSTSYQRDVVEDAGATTVGQSAGDPGSERLRTLSARQARRTGAMRPGGGVGSADAHLYDTDREAAAETIRRLLASAGKSVTFVDPYFDEVALREFGLAVPARRAEIKILTSYRPERRPDAAGAVPMQRIDDELREASGLFRDKGLGSLDMRVTGKALLAYHDRFLVIDGEAWHCGHSFNQVGRGEVSMMTRLRRPEAVVARIDADFAAAETFEAAHRRWLSTRPPPLPGWRAEALRLARRVVALLEGDA